MIAIVSGGLIFKLSASFFFRRQKSSWVTLSKMLLKDEGSSPDVIAITTYLCSIAFIDMFCQIAGGAVAEVWRSVGYGYTDLIRQTSKGNSYSFVSLVSSTTFDD